MPVKRVLVLLWCGRSAARPLTKLSAACGCNGTLVNSSVTTAGNPSAFCVNICATVRGNELILRAEQKVVLPQGADHVMLPQGEHVALPQGWNRGTVGRCANSAEPPPKRVRIRQLDISRGRRTGFPSTCTSTSREGRCTVISRSTTLRSRANS